MKRQVAFSLVMLAVYASALGQSLFPPASKTLLDATHKMPKSGVQVRGDQIVIQAGVGTPSAINVVAISPDSTLLSAGKDFGRIVVWTLSDGKVAHVIQTQQGIVSAVAISPDNRLIASAGTGRGGIVELRDMSSGKILKSISIEKAPVHALEFSKDGAYLIVDENGGASVIAVVAGNRIVLEGERSPVLSEDRTTLLTRTGSDFLVRTLPDLKNPQRFPAPSKYSWPLAVDVQQDLLIYADATDKDSYFAAHLSVPGTPAGRSTGLPSFNPSMGFFSAIVPGRGIVVGHMDGRLWVWSPRTGKTCTSPILYSESGRLSDDGRVLAGSVDNGILANTKIEPGVELWDVNEVIGKCGLD